MRHSFEIVLSLTASSEEEHFATITGNYHRAVAAFAASGEDYSEPSEPASFEIGTITVVIMGKRQDVMPFLTEAQLDAIEQEGVNDYAWTMRPRSALFDRAVEICRPVVKS